MKKHGFTLAETLITLAIIGVVAALTIPTLMKKYEKHVIEIGLKKAYAELQQVIKLSEVDNGSFKEWDYSNSKVFVEKYIQPYYKTLQHCFKPYAYTDIQFLNNEWAGVIHGCYKCVLNNQNLYISSTIQNGYIKYASFYVDINGEKGDNKVGKDVFLFTLFNYTYGSGYTSTCTTSDRYGLYPGGISGFWGGFCASLEGALGDDFVRGNCKKNSRGENCSVAIWKNGWRIPDNYPIKF